MAVERFPFRKVYANDRRFREYLSFWKRCAPEPYARGFAILSMRLDELEQKIRRAERKRRKGRSHARAKR
ncbi:MAG TPA: hypothetical protein VFE62_24175 [Gemmataceae bacterium]|nr:hypothetical protein [Gemmataceae bacterium]